jgi:hypothetical protein
MTHAAPLLRRDLVVAELGHAMMSTLMFEGSRCLMEIKPEELSVRDRYKLMIGSIVPRPIALFLQSHRGRKALESV